MTNMCDDIIHLIWDKCILSIHQTCKIAYELHNYTYLYTMNTFMAWRMVSNIKRSMARSITPYCESNANLIQRAIDRFDHKYKLLPLSSNYLNYNFNNKSVPFMLFKWNRGVAVRLRRHSDEEFVPN